MYAQCITEAVHLSMEAQGRSVFDHALDHEEIQIHKCPSPPTNTTFVLRESVRSGTCERNDRNDPRRRWCSGTDNVHTNN